MSTTHTLVSGLQYLMGLQLATRLSTFVLHTAVLRRVDPSVFGAATQMQVITNLTLFVSREALRRTAMRSDANGSSSTALLPWLALFPLGFVAAVVIGWLWLWGATQEEALVPGFRGAVLMTLLANLVELGGEMAYVRGHRELDFRQRFVVESGSVVAMCLTLFVCIVYADMGVLAWGWAQLGFSLVSTAGYHVMCKASCGELLPKSLALDAKQARLWLAFQWQCVQTLLLQEGERLVLKIFAPLHAQGLYSVVASLGSLVVRILFLPLEEVSYAYFARLLASTSSRQEAKDVLSTLLRFLCILGGFVLALGPPLSFLVIDALYGARMSSTEAPAILKAYCVYITLLAINGVSEAFVRSAIAPAEQYTLNMYLVVISATQTVASVLLLTHFGSTGLVFANCIGMTLRVAYSMHYIRSYFLRHSNALALSSLLPSGKLIVFLVAAHVVLRTRSVQCEEGAVRVFASLPSTGCLTFGALGALLFALGLILVWLFERDWVRALISLWKGRRAKQA